MEERASLEAKTRLPMKTIAYGVAPRTVTDYIRVLEGLAARCCKEFAEAMHSLYCKEYLWIPDDQDLKHIVQFH